LFRIGGLEEFLRERSAHPERVAGMLGTEGAHCLEGDFSSLDRLFEAGYRMLGLTHFFDNELGGSLHGVTGAGLTEFGRQVVDRAEALGMIIDLAHASPRMVEEVLARTAEHNPGSHGPARPELRRLLRADPQRACGLPDSQSRRSAVSRAP